REDGGAGLGGEAVGAVVVLGGRVGERVVGIERHAAVAGAFDQGGAQLVPVGIGVVGQHVQDEWRVEDGVALIIHSDRGRLGRDVWCGDGPPEWAVAGLVGK